MPHARMFLYPPRLPQRLRVELSTALSAAGGARFRPDDVPARHRPSALDPPFRGGDCVDVLLEGSAVIADPRARTATVDVVVGDWRWSAAVFGPRKAVRVAGQVAIGDPVPIERPVPIAFETAFGGGASGDEDLVGTLERDIAIARVYPRNPFGLGYRATPGDATWDLPQIEDPDDPITEERLERMGTEGWESGPLPWCLDETLAIAFPRIALLPGMGPEIADPSRLAEIARGFLTLPLPAAAGGTLDSRFIQDAPPWGWVSSLAPRTVVEVRGCLPRNEVLALELPAAPPFFVKVDGLASELEVRPARLTVRPDTQEIAVLWTADLALPRPFRPGVERGAIEAWMEGAEPVQHPVFPPRSRDSGRGRSTG